MYRLIKLLIFNCNRRKGTKVGFMFTKDGEKVRVSRRTGTIIPKPPELKVTRIREAYQGNNLSCHEYTVYIYCCCVDISLRRAHVIQYIHLLFTTTLLNM